MKNILNLILILYLGIINIGCNEDSGKSFSESCMYGGANAETIEIDGELREYILYVPASYDGDANIPIIFNFHGFGDSAENYMNNADMRALAETEVFILVYPQGSCLDGAPHWNPCTNGGDNKSNANDFGFVESMIVEISFQHNVDMDRIYAVGYSNGGMMAYGLANYKSDLIAAVASVSGSMLDCAGPVSHPMPVIHLHGTSDDTIPYTGSSEWGSVQSTLEHWITFNNTNLNPNVSSDTSGGMTIEHYSYDEGDSSVSVEHYKYIGGEHVWFSARYEGKSTSELVWDFVSSYDINGLR